MMESSLFSLEHMLAEQDAIRAQVKMLVERDQALDRLIEAARAYEAAFMGKPHVSGVVTAGSKAYEGAYGPDTVSRIQARERTRRPAPLLEATEKVVGTVLEAMGEPLQTAHILDLISISDLALPEHNPSNVLSARLSNSTKFESHRGRGWWFKDRPFPGEQVRAFGANESGPQSQDNPGSGPDNGGVQPDHFDDLLQ